MGVAVLLLLCVCVVSVFAVAEAQKEPEHTIQSWGPTVDDKPWKEQKFGDSSKIPLQPVFNDHTIKFIKGVLNDQGAIPSLPHNENLTVFDPPPLPTDEHVESQPRIKMSELKVAFDHTDLDRTGALEIAEAKAILDHFRIHFYSVDELNSYFIDGYMPFNEFCRLLADKGVVSKEDATKASLEYATSLTLDSQDLNDSELFFVKSRAITWFRNYCKPQFPKGPYPPPPGKNQNEVEIGKAAIIHSIIAETGRTDSVTYENAHLSKLEADIEVIRSNGEYHCHPALMESCVIGNPCCQGMVCCPTSVNQGTGHLEGYCAAAC